MEMRGYSSEESPLTDMEMKSRGRRRWELFLPLLLCVYPSEKRASKTFIIPGKLFNVFDIKRLRGRRERAREGGGGGRDGRTDRWRWSFKKMEDREESSGVYAGQDKLESSFRTHKFQLKD